MFTQKSEAALREKFTSKRTVVLISHDAGAIIRLCERAIWLEKGQILAEGNPAEVADKYHRGAANYPIA
jgi:ABC-type polysaccharide/polyol phosphate transport system ATPase subunit